MVPAVPENLKVGDFVEVQGRLKQTDDDNYILSEAAFSAGPPFAYRR